MQAVGRGKTSACGSRGWGQVLVNGTTFVCVVVTQHEPAALPSMGPGPGGAVATPHAVIMDPLHLCPTISHTCILYIRVLSGGLVRAKLVGSEIPALSCSPGWAQARSASQEAPRPRGLT